MWSTLEEFVNWYKAEGFPIRPPFEDPIYITEMSYSFVLYREGQYQVELYLIKPDSESPDHKHPHVENIIMVWGGDANTRVDGVLKEYPAWLNDKAENGTHKLFGMTGEKLTDEQTHAVITGQKGAALLSLEKWADHIPPTSVTINWMGDPVGPSHANLVSPE